MFQCTRAVEYAALRLRLARATVPSDSVFVASSSNKNKTRLANAKSLVLKLCCMENIVRTNENVGPVPTCYAAVRPRHSTFVTAILTF